MGEWGSPRSETRSKDELGQAAEQVQKVLTNVAKMKQLLKELGSGKDDRAIRKQMTMIRAETTELSRGIKKCLQKKPAPEDRTRHEKLGSQFNVVLRDFEAVSSDSLVKEKELFHDQETGRSHTDDSGAQLLVQAKGSTQITADDVLLKQEQEREIQRLESDLVALHECFLDMKALVDVQQESIDVIEGNIAQVVVSTQEANKELTKASDYQKSSRKKMCCLMIAILIIGAIVLVVFLTKKK